MMVWVESGGGGGGGGGDDDDNDLFNHLRNKAEGFESLCLSW